MTGAATSRPSIHATGRRRLRLRRASLRRLPALLLSIALLVPLLPVSAAAAPSAVDSEGGGDRTRVVIELDLAAAGGTGLSPLAEARSAVSPQALGALPAAAAMERAGDVLERALGVGSPTTALGGLPYVAAEVTAEQLDQLLELDVVRNASPDSTVEPLLTDSLPVIGHPGPDGPPLTVGGTTLDGAGTSIAVIDTGVATGHEMFTGATITERCFVAEILGGCPDGTDQQDGPGAAAPRGDHGTHVAGIAMGRPAGERPGGVAPAADLIAIQTFPEGDDASVFDLARAVDWLAGEVGAGQLDDLAAVNMSLGADVASCPTGDTHWDALRDAITELRTAGVPTIGATGNNGHRDQESAPACFDEVISVANADTGTPTQLAASSNVAADTDLAAPGVGIESATTGGTSAYVAKTGTSMAAPHAAGATAMLRQAYPDASVASLRDALRTGLPGRATVSDTRTDGQVTGLPLLDVRGMTLAAGLGSVSAPSGVTTAVAAADVTGTDIEVSWSAVAGAERYDVVAWPGHERCEATSGTSCVLAGLTAGSEIEVWVTATVAGQTSSATSTGPLTVTGVPSAPQDLGVELVSDGEGGELNAELTWSPPAEDGGSAITNYGWEYTTPSAGDPATVTCPASFDLSAATITCDMGPLTPDATYGFEVWATNDAGDGPSASTTFGTGSVPATPTAATADDAGDGSGIDVEWTNSSTADATFHEAHAIPVGSDSPAGSCRIDDGAAGQPGACTIGGLELGVDHDIEVTAVNLTGRSAPAAAGPVTPTGPPGAPQNVVGDAGDGQVTVSWDPPASDGGATITRYQVSVRDRDGAVAGASCEVTGSPAATSCAVADLDNGVPYTFVVTAENRDSADAARTGPASAPSAEVTPATVPDAPTAVQADGGTGEVAVSWTAPADDGGSPIISSTATATAVDGGASMGSCTASTTDTDCTITVSGLSADTDVTVQVTATNARGTGAPSAASAPTTVTAPSDGGGGGGGGGFPPPDDSGDGEAEDTDDGAPVTGGDGQLPSPSTGNAELLVDGQPGTVVQQPSISGVTLEGGGVTASFAPSDGSGTVSPVRDGVLRLPPGGRIGATIEGLDPGSPVTGWLFSDPVRLGSLTVASDGHVDGSWTVPSSVPTGQHTLQVTLTRADGQELAFSLGVEVGDIDGRFPDVRIGSTHWLAIERIADDGITQGAADGTFRPDRSVTRGQMARFLDRLLELPDAGDAGGDPGEELSDIAGTTHEAAIRRVVAAGISQGFTDGTYRPNEPVRRGQLATFLAAAAGLDGLDDGLSTDVAGSTHEATIHAVVAAEIASGYPDGTYRPLQDVTRAQMATLLVGLDDHLADS